MQNKMRMVCKVFNYVIVTFNEMNRAEIVHIYRLVVNNLVVLLYTQTFFTFKLNLKFHMIDSYSQICEIDNCEACGIINGN